MDLEFDEPGGGDPAYPPAGCLEAVTGVGGPDLPGIDVGVEPLSGPPGPGDLVGLGCLRYYARYLLLALEFYNRTGTPWLSGE